MDVIRDVKVGLRLRCEPARRGVLFRGKRSRESRRHPLSLQPPFRSFRDAENPSRFELALTIVQLPRREFLMSVLSAIFAVGCRSRSDGAADGPIGPLLSPAALAARVDDIKNGKIAVLYVGPDALFARGHVPGARNIGAIDSDEGRHALSDALAKLPPETEVVLYCGCCPVKSCPNVRPASAAVRALGRANARVLDLPTRFATDWADKGYPVERS
jgi:hypothetical protein